MGGGSSSDNIAYKCGTHGYEIMNLKEFNNHIDKTHNDNNNNGEAGSVTSSTNKVKVIADFLKSS
jgi:hypothetical protein